MFRNSPFKGTETKCVSKRYRNYPFKRDVAASEDGRLFLLSDNGNVMVTDYNNNGLLLPLSPPLINLHATKTLTYANCRIRKDFDV